ncbi:MAG TPA: alpha/beta hydrolase [Croceibacterium sp.]
MRAQLVLLAAAALASAASAQQDDPSLAPYAEIAESVRLADGRMLHLTCMGEGAPMVILSAGLGDWGVVWNKVQPAIARTTRVCAWDRAGFGLSDPSPAEQTAAASTSDLEQALATRPGPYVIVGHSLGSYESLLFTDRHRAEVVGMVLIDPSFPDQWNRFARVAPAFSLADQQRGSAVMRQCAADLRSGALGPGTPDSAGCLAPFPPAYPTALREALAARRTPEAFETMASINDSVDESATLLVDPRRDYGAMPLVVLTAPERTAPAGAGDDLPAQLPRIAEEIRRGHEELAALSSRGTLVAVEGANHGIQQVRPQAVIDAVETVIAAARAR